MKTNVRPNSRKSGLVVQQLNDETLVYDLETHHAYCLNRTSSLVWRECDGTKLPDEIVTAVSIAYGTKVNKDIVWLALSQLEKEKLLEPAVEIAPKFAAPSRREAILRIALASAVALPIVSSIVVPTAAHAQSCFSNNTACTQSIQCCSNCCKNVGGGINECKPGGGACLP